MANLSKASYHGFELKAFSAPGCWKVEIVEPTRSPVTQERVVSAQFADKTGAESYAEQFVRDHYRHLGLPISITSTPAWREIGQSTPPTDKQPVRWN